VKALVFALVLSAAAAGTSNAAELKLELRGGKVTLDARDVTVRQILAEWARVGQTRIVNSERVGTGPVTLQLTSVPEREALDIILRQVAGYVAAPRAAGAAGASAYDRILILATSSSVQTSRTQASSPAGRVPAAFPARPGAPGIGSPELAPPEPVDMNDDVDEPLTSPAAARPGSAAFGAPPGSASQPGMLAQPAPSPSESTDAQSRPSSPAPAGAATAASPWIVPAGAGTPGVVLQNPGAPGNQASPAGTRPPTPDR
jgi:hypothetical protein